MISSSQASRVAQAPGISVRPASEVRRAAVPAAAVLWIPAVASAMAYPLAVRYLVASIHAAESTGSAAARLLWSLGALAMLALAAAPPLLALRSLYRVRSLTDSHVVAVRRLLHLACAVPPFYLVWIRVAGGMNSLLGNAASGLITWVVLWLVLSAVTWNVSRRERGEIVAAQGEPVPSWSGVMGRVRKVHRFAVVAALATFLILHLANHLFALWSVPAQRTVMLALRSWYRATWVEPVILVLFVVAALSGLLRLGRLTRSPADGFRVLQTASGTYIAVFLVSHIWATLGARLHGIDTNWAFASGGKAGMLATGTAAAVLLYYVFALLAVSVHAGLGLRMVLLARRVRAVAANRSARLTAAFGGAVSVLIVAALLGVRLAG